MEKCIQLQPSTLSAISNAIRTRHIHLCPPTILPKPAESSPSRPLLYNHLTCQCKAGNKGGIVGIRRVRKFGHRRSSDLSFRATHDHNTSHTWNSYTRLLHRRCHTLGRAQSGSPGDPDAAAFCTEKDSVHTHTLLY